jgi:hypothetical protein
MGAQDSTVTAKRKAQTGKRSPARPHLSLRSWISPPQEHTWRCKMLLRLREEDAASDVIYAFEKTGNYITPESRDEWSKSELEEWDGLLRAYERRCSLEDHIIDLSFKLPRNSGRSELGKQKAIAASEFGMAASTAHEREISSFVVEQAYREIWLEGALRQGRARNVEWDPTDHHRFDHIDLESIRSLLNALCQESADLYPEHELGIEVRKRIATIAEARGAKDIWFGKPSAPGHDEDWELAFFFEEVHYAIRKSEEADVPQDVIESMLLRSWIRFLFFNEHKDELAFHLLDRSWDEVHAKFQFHMADYSHLRLQ